jgi:Tfp pilus assembly protein PilW
MKRAFALLAPAVLVVGLVACGDDDDSPDATTADTEATTDETTTEGTEATSSTEGEGTDAEGSTGDAESDMMAQVFPNLSRDQIDCLVEQAGDITEAMDPSQAQQIAEDCDIDPADLTPDMSAISIPDLGDISVPGNMNEIMSQVFPNLDEDQIDCLVDELGGDFDPSKAAQLADTCNIDPSDLTPG